MNTEAKEQYPEPVYIIGMGLSPSDLTRRHLDLIEKADLLIGASRHLAHFQHLAAEKMPIDKRLSQLADRIRERVKRDRIVVLASGDPLFFGIGGYLIAALGPDRVEVRPNISTVAAAFARIKAPWQEAGVVSLHGRGETAALLDALSRHKDVAVFTAPDKNPAWLASFLFAHYSHEVEMCILSELGTPNEQVVWLEPAHAAERTFPEPNLVVLRQNKTPDPRPGSCFIGMPDEGFDHENGLITKSEIRAVTLSKLQLSSHHVLWDLGAGSGAVAIEAGAIITQGRLVAVEKEKRRIEKIRENKRRFELDRLEIVEAVLPEGLSLLPLPDRIFIGGGGKDLKRIIHAAAGFLKPGGRIVINTVLIANIEAASATLEALGYETEIVQVQISKSRSMPFSKRLDPLNPVWIISGFRKLDRTKIR